MLLLRKQTLIHAYCGWPAVARTLVDLPALTQLCGLPSSPGNVNLRESGHRYEGRDWMMARGTPETNMRILFPPLL